MELPIPDFESGASAIPPLRRVLAAPATYRRAGRLVDDDSDGKFPASFTTQEFECETENGDWVDWNTGTGEFQAKVTHEIRGDFSYD